MRIFMHRGVSMYITAPSGRPFSDEDQRLVQQLGKIGFIQYREKPFKLKSEIMSHVYVFGREELTANPRVLWQLGHNMLLEVRHLMLEENDNRQPCFIGLPTAGTPLAQAAAMVDDREMISLSPESACFMQMRSVKKQTHGAHETWIIGKPDTAKQRVFRVDNVVTDGGTKFQMAERFAEDGLATLELDDVILVDRQQGALKRMSDRGFKKPLVMYNLLDLTFLFARLGEWPGSAVKKVEREIADHQFA